MAEKHLGRDEVMALLAKVPRDRRKETACALIGHSRLNTHCFGYRYCGRCDAQLGDNLGGVDAGNALAVIKGHGCGTCKANARSLTWRDRLLMPTAAKWLAKEATDGKAG